MEQLTNKSRKQLKQKMAKALRENLAPLSSEMQKILLDDMVTALENRLEVLALAQADTQLNCKVDLGIQLTNPIP